MQNHLKFLVICAALPVLAVHAAEPAGPPGSPDTGPTWIYLRSPLPGASINCPDAQAAGAGIVKVSLFSDRSGNCPVATVDGNVGVTVEAVATALAGAHGQRTGEQQAGKADTSAIVNRLVDVRLIVLEGEAMGIDELPEVKESLKASEESIGRDLLKEEILSSVRPNPAEVDRIFKDKVREWQLRSVLFARQDDANAMAKELKSGKRFDVLAAKAVADKKAKGNEPGGFVHARDLILPVAAALEKAKVGQVTPPVKVPGGWAIIEVESIRYPQNPQARAEAESISLVEQKKKALKKFYDALVKKYARVDEKLLKKLDFAAKKPGFEAMKKDDRVIATVEGRSPVTVGLLATALGEQFYHGVDNATQGKKLNLSKGTTLDVLLSVRLVSLEVENQGINKSPEFKRRMDAARDGQVFGSFVKKVIVPDVKIEEKKVRAYYDAHKADYTLAAFYKTESIGFSSQQDAEAAVAKLRSGTDFKFLNANADRKLAPGKDTERPTSVISTKGMSPAFARAMDGAKSGDFRVYAASSDQFYAVHVVQVTPPAAQPFEDVSETITNKLFGEAVQKSLEDWMAKLRKAHQVQVYLTKVGG